MGAAAPAVPAHGAPVRRRDRRHPRGLAARPRGDRHGLPRARGARPARRGRSAGRARHPAGSVRSHMVTERIKTAPSSFTLHARNPDHHLVIGGDYMAFGSVASPPNVFDLDRGRRVGNRADNQNLIRLSQMLNVVHFLSGYPVEPIDIHPSIRHLDAISDVLTLDRQTDPRLQPGTPAEPRRDRDGAHRPRGGRGDARARAVDLHRHQLQLATPARFPDAAGHPRDVRAQPDHRDDAVHPGRRDGAR